MLNYLQLFSNPENIKIILVLSDTKDYYSFSIMTGPELPHDRFRVLFLSDDSTPLNREDVVKKIIHIFTTALVYGQAVIDNHFDIPAVEYKRKRERFLQQKDINEIAALLNEVNTVATYTWQDYWTSRFSS